MADKESSSLPVAVAGHASHPDAIARAVEVPAGSNLIDSLSPEEFLTGDDGDITVGRLKTPETDT